MVHSELDKIVANLLGKADVTDYMWHTCIWTCLIASHALRH